MARLKHPPNDLYYVVYMRYIDTDDPLYGEYGYGWFLFLYSVYSDLKLCWPDLRALRSQGYLTWISKMETPYGEDIAAVAQEKGLN